MSRSYKKFPVIRDTESRIKHRFRYKTIANRAVRRSKHIPTGKGGFRKLYESWNICEYRFIGMRDEHEVIREYESLKREPRRNFRFLWIDTDDTPRKAVRSWKKYYKNK